VFAYLGPPERRPAFPIFDSYDVPGHRLMPAAKFTLPCNWLQVKDNSMDPVHTAFLHALSSGYQFTEAFGVVPELDWALTEAGMAYIATRRAGDLVWIRVCDFIPPNIHQFTREIEEATAPKPTSRPVIIRWAVRDGIRAVASGGDPFGTHWREGQVIPTFTQDLVLHRPAASTPEDDRRLLRAEGRRVIVAVERT